MTPYLQSDRPLSVTTPLGKDILLLTGVNGREAISDLYQFTFDFLAENSTDVPFDKLLGQKVVATIRLYDKATRYVGGIVSRMAQGARDQTFTTYRAEVVPQLWLLSRRDQKIGRGSRRGREEI